MPQRAPDPSNDQGRRAEEVASWYFRLNGFLQIPGFVLHSDEPGRPITDADILGVRFPYSKEFLRGIRMADDRWLCRGTFQSQTRIVIAEVKVALCRVNGPWTDPTKGGMERVIRRIGFAPDEMTETIAESLYNTLHWENHDFRIQYVCIGNKENHELETRYPKLKQLTWGDIAAFMWERFDCFGLVKGAPVGWPEFAHQFAASVRQSVRNAYDAEDFMRQYIEEGRGAVRRSRQ